MKSIHINRISTLQGKHNIESIYYYKPLFLAEVCLSRSNFHFHLNRMVPSKDNSNLVCLRQKGAYKNTDLPLLSEMYLFCMFRIPTNYRHSQSDRPDTIPGSNKTSWSIEVMNKSTFWLLGILKSEFLWTSNPLDKYKFRRYQHRNLCRYSQADAGS